MIVSTAGSFQFDWGLLAFLALLALVSVALSLWRLAASLETIAKSYEEYESAEDDG